MSKGGSIEQKIQEMIDNKKQDIDDGLQMMLQEDGSGSSTSDGRSNLALRRGQTIAVKRSKPLVGKTDNVIREADEDTDDEIKTEIDEDEIEDE